jgi:hypothetical protein
MIEHRYEIDELYFLFDADCATRILRNLNFTGLKELGRLWKLLR